MEESIRISTLNDFVFCPKSIYFHELYQKYEKQMYQEKVQVDGTNAHEPIDTKHYSTSKHIFQAMPVYSEQYGLIGKIDIYNAKKKLLTERKKRVKRVFKGYRYQLRAQYFCLVEMGYEVEELQLYSLDDNKSYDVPLPDEEGIILFEHFLSIYREFDPTDPAFSQNPNKCKQCIYRELCDFYNA